MAELHRCISDPREGRSQVGIKSISGNMHQERMYYCAVGIFDSGVKLWRFLSHHGCILQGCCIEFLQKPAGEKISGTYCQPQGEIHLLSVHQTQTKALRKTLTIPIRWTKLMKLKISAPVRLLKNIIERKVYDRIKD